MFSLRAHVQPYAWGSTTAFPELLGLPETAAPQAELWLGAHPSLPADVEIDGCWARLDDAIRRDPGRWLGRRVQERFGDVLPFLMKVLAADAPLSLQAHPSQAQAQRGYADEERARIPVGSPARTYRDPNHKPEIICALTDFHALCGYRSVDAIRNMFAGFGDDELAARCNDVLVEKPDADGLRKVTGALLQSERGACRRLLNLVRNGGAEDDVAARAAMLDDRYPGDPGVLVALLLNDVMLRPGEALFLGPGNLHAYLHGVGVEVMANSDNVLRGGLTPKHVDVDELLVVLDPQPGEIGRVVSFDENAGAVTRWPVPVDDFELLKVAPGGRVVTVEVDGPAILLCTEGTLDVSADGTLRLTRGASAIAAATDLITIEGDGVVFLSRVGGR